MGDRRPNAHVLTKRSETDTDQTAGKKSISTSGFTRSDERTSDHYFGRQRKRAVIKGGGAWIGYRASELLFDPIRPDAMVADINSNSNKTELNIGS